MLSRLGTAASADTLTELDEDLRRLCAERRACQLRGERAMAARLCALIDQRLEQRYAVTSGLVASGNVP